MVDNYDLDNFEPAAKIIVIGVGGAGNNAVNRMTVILGICMDTDSMALRKSLFDRL